MTEDEPAQTYDREGREIDVDRWGNLRSMIGYREVDYTEVDDTMAVSTIWIGLDLRDPGSSRVGPPLIYETRIFGAVWADDVVWHCATFPEAQAQHAVGVDWVRKEIRKRAVEQE